MTDRPRPTHLRPGRRGGRRRALRRRPRPPTSSYALVDSPARPARGRDDRARPRVPVLRRPRGRRRRGARPARGAALAADARAAGAARRGPPRARRVLRAPPPDLRPVDRLVARQPVRPQGAGGDAARSRSARSRPTRRWPPRPATPRRAAPPATRSEPTPCRSSCHAIACCTPAARASATTPAACTARRRCCGSRACCSGDGRAVAWVRAHGRLRDRRPRRGAGSPGRATLRRLLRRGRGASLPLRSRRPPRPRLLRDAVRVARTGGGRRGGALRPSELALVVEHPFALAGRRVVEPWRS